MRILIPECRKLLPTSAHLSYHDYLNLSNVSRGLARVLIIALTVTSTSLRAGLQCEAATYATGPYYPDMLSAMLSICQHHLVPVRLGSMTYYGPEGGEFWCDSYNDSTGQWEPWIGKNVLCWEDEYFLDVSDMDIDTESGGENAASSCNPINLLNGNKYKIHTDISINNADGLSRPEFTRYYNSQGLKAGNHIMGLNWRHSYQRRIIPQDGFRSGNNYFVASGGTSSNPLQSVPSSDEQTACEQGFADLIAERMNNPTPFGNLERVMSGTVLWTGTKCVVKDDHGKYIATIPMFVHNGGYDAYSPGFFKIRLTRPDGKEYAYKRDVTGNGTDWVAENAGVTGSLNEIVSYLPDSNGLPTVRTSVFEYIDANDIKEIYSETGQLLEIHYLNGIAQTLSYNSGILDRVDDNLGRAIVFSYNPGGKVKFVTDETGRQWHYQYDTVGRLEFVTNPDATS